MRLTKKAQMSLIMILVVAIALMFYAVSANWTRISARKTQITIAANTGAANLASQVASYGEYLLRTQMDMALKQVDKTSSFWQWVLAGLLAVVAVVLIIIPTGFTQAMGVALLISAVGYAVGGATDGWGDQQDFTKQWTKAMANITTTEGKFAEQGVQAMLTAVVNDQQEVVDRLDINMDGIWYLPETGQGDPAAKKISRFAYYNSKRLLYLPSGVPFSAVQAVLRDMQKNLGMPKADSINTCERDSGGNLLPVQKFAQCDPCCQDPALRPEPPECTRDLAFLAQCAGVNNPGCTPSSLNACFVYDKDYERRGTVDPDLFMGVLGEDDADPHTMGSDLQPEAFPSFRISGDPSPTGEERYTLDGGAFRGTDATGQFFPLLWTFADSITYVKDLWFTTAADNTSRACHWRSKDTTGAPSCVLDIQAVSPATIGQTYYRPSPAGIAYDQLKVAQPCVEGDCYINAFKNTIDPAPIGYDARRIDGVGALKAFIPPVEEDQCPDDVAGKYWKKGADRLGQTFFNVWEYTPPYDNDAQFQPETEYNITVSPIRSMTGNWMSLGPEVCSTDASTSLVTERWRDDPWDGWVQTMADFSSLAFGLIALPNSSFPMMLNSSFTWGAVLKRATERLDDMTKSLNIAIEDMNHWLQGNTADYNYVGADLWCLPPEGTASLTQAEKDAILQGGVWGSLGSVIGCLEYNENNSSRFADCYKTCSCDKLPRSLVPGFDPNNDATKSAVYEVVFGGSFDQACLTELEEEYTPCTFDEEAYDADLEKCTAAACKKTYDTCEAAICDEMIKSCAGNPDCITAASAACKNHFPCTDAFSKCNADTCVLPACDDGPCLEDVEEAKEDYNKCVFDADGFAAAKQGCWVEDKESYDYCTTKKTTNMVSVDGVMVSRDGPRDSDYMVKVAQSRDLAVNQDAKFEKRALYLSDLSERLIKVRDVFVEAHRYLTSPITDPDVLKSTKALVTTGEPTTMLRDMITWFQNHMGDKADGLGNDVIYGWFSKPAPGSNRAYGPLHLVRVQSSSPGYQRDLTAKTFPVVGGTPDRIPTIETDTNWLGTKRTYWMDDYSGYVAARVIRYDEDQAGLTSFLSGLPLWQRIFSNPHKVDLGGDPVKEIYENCTKNHYMRGTSGGATSYESDPDSDQGDFANGFIFDLPMGSVIPEPLSKCAGQAFLLLQRGMVSETCAQYAPTCTGSPDKVHPWGRDCHYDVKFVPCK